jgi:hypothetical protein
MGLVLLVCRSCQYFGFWLSFDIGEAHGFENLLVSRLAIVAFVKHFHDSEPVADAFDFLEDIHTEISVVRGFVNELLVGEGGDVVFVGLGHGHILSQKITNKKFFLHVFNLFLSCQTALFFFIFMLAMGEI